MRWKLWIVVLALTGPAAAEDDRRTVAAWKGAGHVTIEDLFPFLRELAGSDWLRERIAAGAFHFGGMDWGRALGPDLPARVAQLERMLPRRIEVRIGHDAPAALVNAVAVFRTQILLEMEPQSDAERATRKAVLEEARTAARLVSKARIHAIVKMRKAGAADEWIGAARLLLPAWIGEEARVENIEGGIRLIVPLLEDMSVRCLLRKRGEDVELTIGPDGSAPAPRNAAVAPNTLVTWDVDWTGMRNAARKFQKLERQWKQSELGRREAAELNEIGLALPTDDDWFESLSGWGRESGSVEFRERALWYRTRTPNDGAAPHASPAVWRFQAAKTPYRWITSEPLPEAARVAVTNFARFLSDHESLFAAPEKKLARTRAIQRTVEALAKLEGFGPGSALLGEVRLARYEWKFYPRMKTFDPKFVPCLLFIGSIRHRVRAERSVNRFVSELLGKDPTHGKALRPLPDFGFGRAAFEIDFRSLGVESPIDSLAFRPHIVFDGEFVWIGTFPSWTRQMHDKLKRAKVPNDETLVSYFRVDREPLRLQWPDVHLWAVALASDYDKLGAAPYNSMFQLFERWEGRSRVRGKNRETVIRLVPVR